MLDRHVLAQRNGAHPARRRRLRTVPFLAVALATSLLTAACSTAAPGAAGSDASASGAAAPTAGASSGSPDPTAVRLYTSVTQDTVDAVLAVFAASQPDTKVDVFRAPTGELNARIAAEQRGGDIRADVLWLTDPLSMEQYGSQGLLRTWTPLEIAQVPAAYRTATSFGTRILNLVIVRGAAVEPAPLDWTDLANDAYRDAVAIPDPAFAGSAFGALGYFASAEGYGLDFFRSLRDNGAVQVKSPDEVVTGVAEGRFKAGITLDSSVRAAIAKGSPIARVWPSSGAIAMHSPIAILEGSNRVAGAEAFVNTVLGRAGQEAIAALGWQPVRADVPGPPVEGKQLTLDWTSAFSRQAELLEEYRTIFGG